ncbi:MAG: hypothetical protein ACI85I_001090 [Arenicella sp.]|jgi:hypothetical protein
MRKNLFVKLFFLLAMIGMVSTPTFAQKKRKKKGKEEVTLPKPMNKKPKKPKSKIKDIADVAKKCKSYEGLFTILQDTTSGTAYMQISEDQIGEEFIYFSVIKDGSLLSGHFRGAYGSNDIFSIRRYFNKIELVKENTSFYFDPANALSKAANANISTATLLSESIYAQDSTKKSFLIKADGLFLSETLARLKYSSRNPNAFKLGRMSRDKKKYLGFRNYPENTDVSVELVYDNPSPRNFGGPGITDARYVSIQMQHSFIKMPDNNYESRDDDPRLGFFLDYTTDMTATDASPYKDKIKRWNLEKKDPNAALSDPVEPITWWIENTTPVEYRDAVKAGVEEWNKAFEKAGFTNAVVAKVQPDDADWDADDMRYNVLRWTSSPLVPFRGYGPAFTNPRTGQILGADVMLEFAILKSVSQEMNVFGDRSLDSEEEEVFDFQHGKHEGCAIAEMIPADLQLGMDFIKFAGKGQAEKTRMQNELIKWVVMHEVGHTLGLSHNMKASQIHSPAQLQDRELTEKVGLIGSVMDYPTINLSKDPAKQGNYYTTTVGPYDNWIIEYGYTPNLTKTQLNDIAKRSSEPYLMFGNDADDMRASGKAIDPRVMIFDLSSDVVGYSSDRMDIVMDMMKGMKTKYNKEGETYQEFRNAFFTLWQNYYAAANVSSRYIGGVYVDRSFQGQEGATKPFTPTPLAYQKKAMQLLSERVFAPDAFDVPEEIYSHLQTQRRGFNFFGRSEDPKIHSYTAAIQRNVLSHILHRNTLNRIVDSELYGNEYKLGTFMTDLNDAIFKADQYTNVNSFRQNLQLNYVKQLIDMIGGKISARYPNQAKSMALYNLQQIKKIATNGRGDLATKAHKSHLALLIDKAMEG